MRAAEFTISGDSILSIFKGPNPWREDGDLTSLAKEIMQDTESARKKLYLPHGTEILEAIADEGWLDQIQFIVSHESLPILPHGARPVFIVPTWKRRGRVVVFQDWGLPDDPR